MTHDLTTQDGRTAAIKAIENSFLISLRVNKFDVCPDAVCRINKNSIELGISATGAAMDKGFRIAFASSIELYAASPDDIFGDKENSINFGSSGSFNPSVKESFWRTIHAASILKNWETAINIINTHCKMYADLEKEIFELTQ